MHVTSSGTMHASPLMSSRLSVSIFAFVFAALVGCGAAPANPPVTKDASVDDSHVHVSDVGRVADVPSRCVGGAPLPYPESAMISDLSPLPEMTFEGEGGVRVSTRDFYQPCATRPQLLVIRVMGAWSGPSRHAAEHTRRLLEHTTGSRLTVLDILVLGQDDLPAAVRDIAPWRARYDAVPWRVVIDPEYRFRSLYLGGGMLPIVVLVDTRTMVPRRVLTMPVWDDVSNALTRAVAQMDGVDPPRDRPRELRDGLFTVDQWEMLQGTVMPTSPPPDPTNRYADDARAAALGARLFEDRRLSSSGEVSCATCHARERVFTDGRATGVGLRTGDRNTPTALFTGHSRWLFWDGRADSAWSQALGPVENPAEMAGSRLEVAHLLARSYRAEYEAIFGALPPLDDRARFPAAGRPGVAAWDAMRADDQQAIHRVFVNFGKSIAAFERTLRLRPTALDRYVRGETSALSASARRGLANFMEVGCIQCHHGPALTDDSFHNIGFASGRTDGQADIGRAGAIDTLLASPFRADGMFSDQPTGAHLEGLTMQSAMRGQFHTAPLRGVAATGPWGHGGTFGTLREVVLHYAQSTTRRMPLATTTGTQDMHLVGFHMDEATLQDLVALMGAMTPEPLYE
jgi:cytochrome c peroxidase